MWSDYDSPINRAYSNARGATSESNEGRKAALVKEIEAFVRGERLREISARELAGMNGGDRLLTLRKGKLISLYRAYHREGARTSLLPGVLDLISIFGDNDVDGFCWLGQDRIAKLLNTDRTSVLRALKEAEREGLVAKVAARPGFSNGYILAMPSAVADPKVSIFDLLDILAPRAPGVLPHGRRREVGKSSAGADLSANPLGSKSSLATGLPTNSRDRGRTSDSNRCEATVTSVDNRCYSKAVTAVTLESPDSSNDPSVEEEVFTHTGPQNFFFFDGAPSEVPDEISVQEVGPTPLPPPTAAYATSVYAIHANTTTEDLGSFGDATFSTAADRITDEIVQTFAEILAWQPPHQRASAWSPRLDLELARKHLSNVLTTDAGAGPDVCEQALRDAVGALRSKIDDADAVAARGEATTDANIVSKPIAYLKAVFKKRVREIPIERHTDDLSKRNATYKARVEAEADSKVGAMKIAAFGAAIERKAATQQKIADGRVERAGASRSTRGRAHAVIAGEDGSKTFEPYAEVMTVHRTKILGRDAIAIMGSFDGATVDDVIDALRLVEDRDKPRTNGKGNYFDPLPASDVIGLAKGYLRTVTLHRMRGLPESFIDGPVAEVEQIELLRGHKIRKVKPLKSNLVAIGLQWLNDLIERLPDLNNVKSVGDGVRALDLPNEVLSASGAHGCASHVEAAFKIASLEAPSHIDKYGRELTSLVQGKMEAILNRINELGRTNRERIEAAQREQEKRSRLAEAEHRGQDELDREIVATQTRYVSPEPEWFRAYRERIAARSPVSDSEGENEAIH
ncbi:MAG TPA: hypothetical protein VHC71_03700 [Hyphomicrobium sp.]|nr:hypothetical protein [Hyphomicrobium sp.]